jgi:hypothetical protein
MTNEDIIKLARNADREWDCDRNMMEWVLEFGEAVAARERKDIALMIERSIDLQGLSDWPVWQRFIGELLATTAELIRARGRND